MSERTTMRRAVTINRAELKVLAVAAEATRNGLPFKSNEPHHCARLARPHEMQFLFND
jgi:hypothetical protein